MHNLSFLKVYFSPFIRPKLKFYLGQIKYGVPIFLPRRFVRSKEKPGYLVSVPKRIGFDLIGLRWKTKWTETDYRFESNPIWSFVFFKWQFCILFFIDNAGFYWESWLYYERNTDKTKSIRERIQECQEKFPQTWISWNKDQQKIKTDYYRINLKKKYLDFNTK